MNEAYYVKTEEKEHTVKIQNKEEKFYSHDAELVENPTGTLVEKTITENGEYLPASDNADGYSKVTVNTPIKTLIEKTITANGEYLPASDNADGYSKVTVAVPIPTSKLPQVLDKSVTELTADDLAGCTKIGNSAFYNCIRLTSITIPDSVTSIGEYAFSYCTGLTSIAIPDSVTSIENSAFSDCTGLKAVYITDIAKWCGISFSGYQANPLNYAYNLYLNGARITDLVIPDGVTSIEKYAFYNCRSLTSVTIPGSVTSIGNSAFYNCIRLTSVTIEATTPPVLGSTNVFTSTNNYPIYVPTASVEAYKAATNWSRLASRIFAIQE